MFEPASVGILHDMLDAEGSRSICLANLGNVEVYDPPPARYVDRSMDATRYISLLRGNGGPDAWLYLVDRYACASDVGSWSIYCEKEEDIAIFAIRRERDAEKFSTVMDSLRAKPIEASNRRSRPGELKFEMLKPVWLSALTNSYAKSRLRTL